MCFNDITVCSLMKSLRNEGCNCCDDADRLVEALRVSREHLRVQEVSSNKREEEIKLMVEKNQRLVETVAHRKIH